MVGGNTTFDGVFQTLDREKIPIIGGLGTAPEERSVSTSFPISGSAPGYGYGAADMLAKAGSKSPVFFGCDNAACTDSGSLFTTAMEDRGIEARTVTAPPSQPDYAAAAARVATDGTDGVFIACYPADLPKKVKALRQVGYTGPIATYSTLATQPTIAALGREADGLLIVGAVSPTAAADNPGIIQFTKDIEAAGSQVPAAEMGDLGVSAWASVQLFAQLAERLDSITSESVLAAMNGLSDPIDVQVTAPYAVAGRTSPLSEEDPRIFNPTMVYSTVANGTIVTVDQFVDPFASN